MMNKMYEKLSLLVAMYNEEEIVEIFFGVTIPILESLPVAWEIVCVNDGSYDHTLGLLQAWNRRDNRIKVINLSRNFGKECAITAGLDYVTGDAVIPIDADLQDPPEIIPKMVELWLGGVDVVNAARSSRESDTYMKRTTSHFFYKLMNAISDVPIPQNVGDFRLLSKRVYEILRTIRERRRFMKGLFSWVGFSTATLYYERKPRIAGTTKWNYWKLWSFAIEGITSFSTVPLKIATYLGLLTAGISMFCSLFLIVDTIAFGNPVKGYPSLITAVFFIGGVQLVFIGIIGEYISRIHDEVKGRPIYIVESVFGVNK
jgi:glycosyltransferase involved in cell wall biosynthesis